MYCQILFSSKQKTNFLKVSNYNRCWLAVQLYIAAPLVVSKFMPTTYLPDPPSFTPSICCIYTTCFD